MQGCGDARLQNFESFTIAIFPARTRLHSCPVLYQAKNGLRKNYRYLPSGDELGWDKKSGLIANPEGGNYRGMEVVALHCKL